MKKWILLLGMIFLFFGCVKITMEQKINSDGRSDDIAVTMDVSALTASAGSAATDEQLKQSCTQMMKDDKNITACEYKGNGIFMLKTKPTGGDVITVEKGLLETVYRFERKTDLGELSSLQGGQFGTEGPDLNAMKSSIAQMKSLGVEMTYVLEMPAPITSAEGATKIEGKKATFNMLDYIEQGRTKMVVEAKELNIVNVAIAVVVLLVIVAGIVMMTKKK